MAGMLQEIDELVEAHHAAVRPFDLVGAIAEQIQSTVARHDDRLACVGGAPLQADRRALGAVSPRPERDRSDRR